MQISSIRVRHSGHNWRAASIATARTSFIASLPREGRVQRQARRAFIASARPISMTELREWCYPRQARQHWHHTNIYRALKRLGARRIGWGTYAINRYVTGCTI